MFYSWMELCSGHGNSVVIRELSLYPQSLLAKLTVAYSSTDTTRGVGLEYMYMSEGSACGLELLKVCAFFHVLVNTVFSGV